MRLPPVLSAAFSWMFVLFHFVEKVIQAINFLLLCVNCIQQRSSMACQNPFHFPSSLPLRQLHTLLDNFRVTASVNEILTEDALSV